MTMDKPFFMEFFVCNPALAEDQPVLGQLPANQVSGNGNSENVETRALCWKHHPWIWTIPHF